MSSSWFDVQEILPDIYRVNDGDFDTLYVLKGTERTGVIDTGLGIGALGWLVAELCDKHPLVINTHAHPDHWQGNAQFSETSMSAAEWTWVESRRDVADQSNKPHVGLKALNLKRPLPEGYDPSTWTGSRVVRPNHLWQEGDIIDLGGFRLEVILIPAHTPGGIALLDRQRRLMFTGDTVITWPVWLQLDESQPPDVVFATYAKLASYADVVDWVLPAHSLEMYPSSILTDMHLGAERIRRGEVEPFFQETFAGDGWVYVTEGCQLMFRNKLGEE